MANAHAAFHFATETLKWPKDAQLFFVVKNVAPEKDHGPCRWET